MRLTRGRQAVGCAATAARGRGRPRDKSRVHGSAVGCGMLGSRVWGRKLKRRCKSGDVKRQCQRQKVDERHGMGGWGTLQRRVPRHQKVQGRVAGAARGWQVGEEQNNV